MHHFFIVSNEFLNNEILFSPETSRQIARVLRLKPGNQLIVLDNLGNEFLTELTHVAENGCSGLILGKQTSKAEPRTKLTLMVCLTQREKFEWILQKCTEVGVTAFRPLVSSRSLVQNVAEVVEKYPRWKKIVKEAAEQSGRGVIPELLDPSKLEAAMLDTAKKNDICLIPWEGEQQVSIREALHITTGRTIAVLIGPEGGFSEEEVGQAQVCGFIPVTLGPRILRMETAAVVAAALVFNELESV